jgi:hypothetical protein
MHTHKSSVRLVFAVVGCVVATAFASNDNHNDRLSIGNSTSGRVTSSTTFASRQTGERIDIAVKHSETYADGRAPSTLADTTASVWFAWKAAASRVVTFRAQSVATGSSGSTCERGILTTSYHAGTTPTLTLMLTLSSHSLALTALCLRRRRSLVDSLPRRVLGAG